MCLRVETRLKRSRVLKILAKEFTKDLTFVIFKRERQLSFKRQEQRRIISGSDYILQGATRK
jgi:hypothetical protein